MSKILLLIAGLLLLFSCGIVKPDGTFETSTPPTSPNYAQLDSWAAHPDKADNADRLPDGVEKEMSLEDKVDVFFLHPTTYNGKKGHRNWNGDIQDAQLNERTDGSTILYQASIFNGAGRVFAPRYRQAHIYAYFSADKSSAKEAFELAYTDIKAAFQYYLDNHNQGRPIIIAAHSQGTTHGTRLVAEFFDGKTLQDQLVTAYLVGMPLATEQFKEIPLCDSPSDTQCFSAWQTYKTGYYPKKYVYGEQYAVTNPLSWTLDTNYQPKSANEGAILRKFEKLLPELVDAQIEKGMLWVNKPKFPGSFFFRSKRYHIVDFNFFYMNVRNNAILRAETFLGEMGDK